jgi:hypothetical protein
MEYPLRDGKGTKAKSLKEFKLKNGITIGIFQGSRGDNPVLDIIIKYQGEGMRVPRTPQHLHWAVDLLIKKEHERDLTRKFVKYLSDMWDKVQPFKNKEEQQDCQLKLSNPENLNEFEELNKYGEYSIEFIAKVMELLMIQEKNGSHKAFMFKKVLDGIYNERPLFHIISGAGYGGRKSK